MKAIVAAQLFLTNVGKFPEVWTKQIGHFVALPPTGVTVPDENFADLIPPALGVCAQLFKTSVSYAVDHDQETLDFILESLKTVAPRFYCLFKDIEKNNFFGVTLDDEADSDVAVKVIGNFDFDEFAKELVTNQFELSIEERRTLAVFITLFSSAFALFTVSSQASALGASALAHLDGEINEILRLVQKNSSLLQTFDFPMTSDVILFLERVGTLSNTEARKLADFTALMLSLESSKTFYSIAWKQILEGKEVYPRVEEVTMWINLIKQHTEELQNRLDIKKLVSCTDMWQFSLKTGPLFLGEAYTKTIEEFKKVVEKNYMKNLTYAVLDNSALLRCLFYADEKLLSPFYAQIKRQHLSVDDFADNFEEAVQ